MEELVKDTVSTPIRDFVKYRLDGFRGEILRCAHPHASARLTAIIPTRDAYGKGWFPLLFEQLQRQSIWDQAELVVIKGDNRQGRAINVGAALAKGRYILTMDDDEVLGDDRVLERLLEVMENNPDIAMAGGINVIPPDAPYFVRRAMKEIPRRSTPPVTEVTDSDMAEHGLLMMKKEVFTHVGGENELLPRGLDPYLRQEFRKAGYRVVVVPGANYSHFPPKTLFKLINQFYGNGKQAAFCNKFYPQWVIETPEKHGGDFQGKASLTFRLLRYPIRMLKAAIQLKWILLLSQVCYAIGFLWGYLTFRERGQYRAFQ
jgi:GT2 family glycosyltransferase